MIRAVKITRFVAKAITTVLWLSRAAARSQPLPGATMESVVAFAKRLNATVATVALDFGAALRLNVEIKTKHAEMERLAGGSL